MAVILTAISLSTPISSFAQESSTTVVSTDDKITMIKDMSGLENEKITFTFYIYNTGSIAATNVTLIASSLTIKEGSGAFSGAPSVIDRNSVIVQAEGTHLESHGVLLANYTIKQDVNEKLRFDEATYAGTIKVVGDNFDGQTIDVEVTFRYNPLWYFVFTIVGLILAIITGHVGYTKWEEHIEMMRDVYDDIGIIDKVNDHIINVNIFRNTIDSSAWQNIRKEYELRAEQIEKGRDSSQLSVDAEAVTWFRLLDESIHASKIFDADDPGRKNEALELFVLPDDRKMKDNLKKRINERINEKKKINKKLATFYIKKLLRKPVIEEKEIWDEKDIESIDQKKRDEVRKAWEDEISTITNKKTIYAIAVTAVSLLVSIVANANFIGNILLTAGVGIAIGFAAYRLQDISGLLKTRSNGS